ncbi:hypothetical protein BKA70DRAFT_1402930 [Coprinopsis sp. MPI-PUGE-AT-0042]|nr:hypothetical protein BKA70DRAFT_1402930 [Coprinopsis sp. MPI-PUGE-AT-0042]
MAPSALSSPFAAFLCPVLAGEFRSRSWYSRDKKILIGVAPQLLASPKQIASYSLVLSWFKKAPNNEHGDLRRRGSKPTRPKADNLLALNHVTSNNAKMSHSPSHPVHSDIISGRFRPYRLSHFPNQNHDFLALHSAHPIKTSYKFSLIRYANPSRAHGPAAEKAVSIKLPLMQQTTSSWTCKTLRSTKLRPCPPRMAEDLTPSLTLLGISQNTQRRRDSGGMTLPLGLWAHMMHQDRQHGHPVHMNTGRLGYVTRRRMPPALQITQIETNANPPPTYRLPHSRDLALIISWYKILQPARPPVCSSSRKAGLGTTSAVQLWDGPPAGLSEDFEQPVNGTANCLARAPVGVAFLECVAGFWSLDQLGWEGEAPQIPLINIRDLSDSSLTLCRNFRPQGRLESEGVALHQPSTMSCSGGGYCHPEWVRHTTNLWHMQIQDNITSTCVQVSENPATARILASFSFETEGGLAGSNSSFMQDKANVT